eukprot:snap_masked-scaffold_44-processed-gene-0.40-mRNA-1 protein AED:1.00 eAED:1.00 QI:0/0/0/0/1/1/2/0/151
MVKIQTKTNIRRIRKDLLRESVLIPFSYVPRYRKVDDRWKRIPKREIDPAVDASVRQFMKRFETIWREHIKGFGTIRVKEQKDMEWKKRLKLKAVVKDQETQKRRNQTLRSYQEAKDRKTSGEYSKSRKKFTFVFQILCIYRIFVAVPEIY